MPLEQWNLNFYWRFLHLKFMGQQFEACSKLSTHQRHRNFVQFMGRGCSGLSFVANISLRISQLLLEVFHSDLKIIFRNDNGWDYCSRHNVFSWCLWHLIDSNFIPSVQSGSSSWNTRKASQRNSWCLEKWGMKYANPDQSIGMTHPELIRKRGSMVAICCQHFLKIPRALWEAPSVPPRIRSREGEWQFFIVGSTGWRQYST